MELPTNSVIHTRFKTFVDWVAPEDSTEETIKTQSDEIRCRLQPKAEAAGLTVAEMPFSGSFAKKTGLRRFMRGNAEEEGQDVDIAFILEAKDKDGNDVGCQIENFRKWLEESYPKSEVGNSKSSATIDFVGTKLAYDIVPLVKTTNPDIQHLHRTNGDVWQSSVKKQIEFVKKRNRSSNEIAGVVSYNQCVRLIKWWRTHQQTTSPIFKNDSDDRVPTFLLDLLCAKAYDECSVKKTYPETLATWFSYLAHVVNDRQTVHFTDYGTKKPTQGDAKWVVADPVDATNNVVAKWDSTQINELSKWLDTARSKMIQAIRKDREGDDSGSMDCLVILFGNAFKNNV